MIPLQDTIPSRRFPLMNYLLILANVLVFMYQLALGPRALEVFVMRHGLIPSRFWAQPSFTEFWTIISAMFMHGGWFHLISNMWALYIFGDNVEDSMGSLRYLAFYLLSGIAAAMLHLVFNWESSIPVVGASGAIAGVMGAYFVLYPHARVITLVPFGFLWFTQIPAVFYLGIWFITQLYQGLLTFAFMGTNSAYGGVAWWAHIGGFIAGVILVQIMRDRKTFRHWYADEYSPW